MPLPVIPQRLVTARDLDVLTALARCPLTCEQLLKLSETFAHPFTDLRRVRERLQILVAAGRVRQWRYATADRGAPNYYALSPLGYRILHGDDASQPPKRSHGPIGIAHQHHARSLAEFIVHTAVSAHRTGVSLSGFYRENTVRLSVGDESLFPDCGFQLIDPDGRAFSFFVEVDGGTERIRSANDLDSWERKIRLYDHFQDHATKLFRVLIISIRSTLRVGHILDAAARLQRNPHRSLFYGINLPAYLAETEPLQTPCFRDHRGRAVPLLPPQASNRSPFQPAESLSISVRGSPSRDLSTLST
jgi:hypothetical protein